MQDHSQGKGKQKGYGKRGNIPGVDAPFVPLQFDGYFQHPRIKPGDIHISVVLLSRTSGQWTALGQTESITVSNIGSVIILGDGTTELHGIVQPSGVIEGFTMQRGVRGGGFKLTPQVEGMTATRPDKNSSKISAAQLAAAAQQAQQTVNAAPTGDWICPSCSAMISAEVAVCRCGGCRPAGSDAAMQAVAQAELNAAQADAARAHNAVPLSKTQLAVAQARQEEEIATAQALALMQAQMLAYAQAQAEEQANQAAQNAFQLEQLQQAAAEPWCCRRCTTKNPQMDPACARCGTERSYVDGGAAFSQESSVVPSPKTWNCPKCSQTCSGSVRKCPSCGGSRPLPSLKDKKASFQAALDKNKSDAPSGREGRRSKWGPPSDEPGLGGGGCGGCGGGSPGPPPLPPASIAQAAANAATAAMGGPRSSGGGRRASFTDDAASYSGPAIPSFGDRPYGQGPADVAGEIESAAHQVKAAVAKAAAAKKAQAAAGRVKMDKDKSVRVDRVPKKMSGESLLMILSSLFGDTKRVQFGLHLGTENLYANVEFAEPESAAQAIATGRFQFGDEVLEVSAVP